MARKKIKLQYIADAIQRRQSFKLRKKGLIKKLDEIRILCGIDACAIIYDQTKPNPKVYPSNSEVKDVIERFEKMALKDQTNRSVNQEAFLRQHIAKIEKATKRVIEENHDSCMREVMFKLLGAEMNDFQMSDVDRLNVSKYIDQYLNELLHHKYVTLQNPLFESGESSEAGNMATNMPSIPFMANMATNMAPIPSMATNMAPIPFMPNMAPIPSMATNMAPIPFMLNMAPIPSMATNMSPIPSMATNMTPIPSMAPTAMCEGSRPYSFLNVPSFKTPYFEAGESSSMAPTTMWEAGRPYFEAGESSSMAMVPNMSQAIAATTMAPTLPVVPFMAPTTMSEASRPYFETGGSSSIAMVPNMPQAIVATTMAPLFMAPPTMCEASSSKSPQPTNELQCMVSAYLPANSLAANLLSNNNQEIYSPAMNQAIIPSYQGSEQFGSLDVLPYNNNQEFYIPVIGQDQFYNPNQNGAVDEMMGLAEQTGFPWMEDNHRYNQN